MRWTAFAATLTPEDYARLVNLFTAGKGYAYLAARAADRNLEAGAVIRHLDRALSHLLSVRGLLAPESRGDTAALPSVGAEAAADSRRWRTFLDTRVPQDADQIRTALTDAVFYSRRTALVITEDGAIDALRHRLERSLASLTLARRLCELLLLA